MGGLEIYFANIIRRAERGGWRMGDKVSCTKGDEMF
jgi:hypothetical protein